MITLNKEIYDDIFSILNKIKGDINSSNILNDFSEFISKDINNILDAIKILASEEEYKEAIIKLIKNDTSYNYYLIDFIEKEYNLYYNIRLKDYSYESEFGETILIYNLSLKNIIKTYSKKVNNEDPLITDDILSIIKTANNKYQKINKYYKYITGQTIMYLTELNRGNFPLIQLDKDYFNKVYKKSGYDAIQTFVSSLIESESKRSAQFSVNHKVLYSDVSILSKLIPKHIDDEYIYNSTSKIIEENIFKSIFSLNLTVTKILRKTRNLVF